MDSVIKKEKSLFSFEKLNAVSFLDMEATYAEYEEWSDQGVAETVVHQYKKALQQMEKCKALEEPLVTDFCW